MKKCELVLGNVVKAYKGEEEFVITNINEEAVKKVEIELPTFQLKLMAPMVTGLLPEGKTEKANEVIYGIKVSKGINQTLIWKVLKKVCELKNEEGTKIAKELKEKYPVPFEGAVRCLVSKKRINYINSIC